MEYDYRYRVSLNNDGRIVTVETDDLNELISVEWFRAFLGLEIVQPEETTVEQQQEEMPQQQNNELPEFPEQGGANNGN